MSDDYIWDGKNWVAQTQEAEDRMKLSDIWFILKNMMSHMNYNVYWVNDDDNYVYYRMSEKHDPKKTSFISEVLKTDLFKANDNLTLHEVGVTMIRQVYG